MKHDPVNHPKHYVSHPSGIECVQITEHMGFCLGNVVKYVWRADLKNGIEDLKKAKYYLEREIAKRMAAMPPVYTEEMRQWDSLPLCEACSTAPAIANSVPLRCVACYKP